ncbi:MFS transporter [Isoptericola sp. NEAU-Y5]|uniref:MFS transporter n=1 Tax=Isoptericola luteus TaxID=2879484 RepID=A0ABS7ZAH5_9MICO|nr:MFS transporter [Isoptericola sp. NEAU-Y5]MCA5891898.1 MFS transporter [Isoptericola sp. NEAU-Y5]
MPRNPYLDVLSVPGALRFSAAGTLARLPMSMIGIGTILMVQGLYGSYAMAGRVSAVLVVAQALVAPQIARLVDRTGQARVMTPMLVLTTIGLLGLVVAAALGAPEWVLWVCAAVGGASQGSYGSLARARWSYALPEPRRVHTAFSLESALDELVFIVGPVLATVLATSVVASGGLLVAAVVGGGGAAWFLAQRRTEPPATGRVAASDDAQVVATVQTPEVRALEGRSAIRMPGMPVLAVVFVAMGVMFGSSDVATVAFADEQGVKGRAGLVLACFAFGSLVSGLAYGARHWVSPLSTRFVIGAGGIAVGVSLFFFVQDLVALGAVMFVAGFAIAPTLINGNALVQALVAPHQLTEGLTWVGTALGVGVSLGSWLAGSAVDAVDSHAGFLVTMSGGWLCALLALAALPSMRRRRPHAALTTV